MAAFGHVMAVEHQPGQALGQVGDEGLRRPAVGAGRAPEEIEVDLGLTPLVVAQPGALRHGGADGCPTQEEEERQKKVAEVAGEQGGALIFAMTVAMRLIGSRDDEVGAKIT